MNEASRLDLQTRGLGNEMCSRCYIKGWLTEVWQGIEARITLVSDEPDRSAPGHSDQSGGVHGSMASLSHQQTQRRHARQTHGAEDHRLS